MASTQANASSVASAADGATTAAAAAEREQGRKKKEIYDYIAPHLIYGVGWSHRRDAGLRLALGSFIEDYSNKVDIVKLVEDENSGDWKFKKQATIEHPYPTTKVAWKPDMEGTSKDQLMTAGDYLRLWTVQSSAFQAQNNTRVVEEQKFENEKDSVYCAPVTSFDWCEADPSLVVASSIDTSCTVWDISEKRIRTQIIAHDKEAFDVAWQPQSCHTFASVGADGSVRVFDLRNMEHSTIIHESKDLTPLLRLSWNKLDTNYMAAIGIDDRKATILDIRVPSIPVAKLATHAASVNSIAWAPHSSVHICSAGDDKRALIWDLSPLPKVIESPILGYEADAEINQMQWCTLEPDWIAIACGQKLQILKV